MKITDHSVIMKSICKRGEQYIKVDDLIIWLVLSQSKGMTLDDIIDSAKSMEYVDYK